jgi:DNA-binding FadR family transcriptional regulator
MSIEFLKAKQVRVSQNVVDQIEDAIIKGTLIPGNKLPPERELTELLGVSRGTVREALRTLEQKGLIEVKLGINGGAVIKPFSTEQLSESLGLLIRRQRVSLDHLAEFREGVEGNVAGLAAERAGKADIRRLKKLLDEGKSYLDEEPSNWEAFVQVDEKIHIALPQIAQNPIYISVLRMVHDNIHRYYLSFLPKEKAVQKENYQDLCDIVRAVEQGQANEARSLAMHHVRKFQRYMKKKKQELSVK